MSRSLVGSSSRSRSAGSSINLRDQNPGPFTAGQTADGLVQLFARESESRSPGGDMDRVLAVQHRIAMRSQRSAQS